MPTLDWIGKSAVVGHHRKVPYRLLQCDKALSAGDPDAGNLLVQGDNLEALKSLLPYYAGQVKCIYIDPPYNTGNEGWVYNDNVNSPEIRRWLGEVVGKEAEDLSRHDKWLCMMYPRMALLKQLLREDGVIIVHIDEHEQATLTLLLDDFFGRRNSLGTIAWDKGNPKGDSGKISSQHEYIVCYARNRSAFEERHGPIMVPKRNAEEMLAKARSLCRKIGREVLPDDFAEFAKKFDLPAECVAPYRRKYTLDDARAEYRRWIDSNDALTGGERPYFRIFSEHAEVYRLASMAWPNKKKAPDEYFLPLKHDTTGRACPVPDRGWRYPPKTMQRMLDENRIEFGDDESVQPQQRLFLSDYLEQRMPSVIRDARSDDDFFAALGISFENPKPLGFATRLVSAFSKPHDIVFDSFAGSGTTGHAVLAANSQDGGTRRFVLVELDVENAHKASSRLHAAIEGQADISQLQEPLGSGFRFCRLGKPLFDENGAIAEEVSFTDLAAHVFFTETGSPIPKRARKDNPLLGVHRGRAIYLLFNGVLGDKRPEGGNVLTHAVAQELPEHPDGDGVRVVFGEACRLGVKALAGYGIVFRQMPFELKVS